MSLKIREAGPQDPIYGIHHENITDRLTRLNWKTQAVVRCDWEMSFYLWVVRGNFQDADGHKQYAYFVRVYTQQSKELTSRFEEQFQYLTDALQYVNGEDNGLLSKRTWPAHPELTYPPEQEAPYYIGYGRPIKIIPHR